MPFRRNRWWATALTAVLLLFAIGCPAANAPHAELDNRTDALPLTPYLSYLHDKTAVDSADDAWRLIAAGRFERVPNGKTAFGFQQGAYWFHAKVVNQNPDEPYWMLVQSFALLDRVDVYLR